jgi:hypothetical protein
MEHFHLTSVIYTTEKDANQIASHPSFLKLSEKIPAEIVSTIDEDSIQKDSRYGAKGRYRSLSLKRAIANRSVAMLLSPDVLMSDGGLFACCKWIESGYKAVNIAALNRAATESTIPELDRFLDREKWALSLSSKDLVDLGLRHMHDAGKFAFWRGNTLSRWLSYLYWKAGENSLVAKFFHVHPIAIDVRDTSAKLPEIVVSDDGGVVDYFKFSKSEIYTVTDSNQAACLDLSSHFDQPRIHAPSSKEKLKSLLHFTLKYTRPSEIEIFLKHTIRFQGHEEVDWNVSENEMRQDLQAASQALAYLKVAKSFYCMLKRFAKALGAGRVKRFLQKRRLHQIR